MEFVLGAIVAAVVFFFISAKKHVDEFNTLCLLNFPSWLSLYTTSGQPQKSGIARAFLLQTLHLAEQSGAMSGSDCRVREQSLKTQDPVAAVDHWLRSLLPDVLAVCGEGNLSNVDARQVGVFMLLCLYRTEPREYLKQYIESHS